MWASPTTCKRLQTRSLNPSASVILWLPVPRVTVVGRFKFFIWPNDHPPAHVHVQFGGEEAVVRLGYGPDSVSMVWISSGASFSDVRPVLEATRQSWSTLWKAWMSLHGE